MSSGQRKSNKSNLSYRLEQTSGTITPARKKSLIFSSLKPKTILIKPRSFTGVVVNGVDVTPKPLNYTLGGKERQISFMRDDGDSSSLAEGSLITRSQSITKFKSDIQNQHIKSEATGRRMSYLTSYVDDVYIDTDYSEKVEEDEREDFEECSVMTGQNKPPSHVSLILKETETTILFELPSCTAIRESDEGNLVEEDNKMYDFLTSEKGRNRKVVHVEVQTIPIVQKSRYTEGTKIKRKNNFSFVSNWVMYDTYNKSSQEQEEQEESDGDDDNEIKVLSTGSTESCTISNDEKQMEKLMKNLKFLESVCVIERLLANNCYSEKQKRFKGLSDPEPFRENIKYKYRLNLLWTFDNEKTKNRCVTSMQWNPANPDLLAVGYGKFYFIEQVNGMVMIWNIKNPIQPEREYTFTHPVTTVSFSKLNPNALAVGLYDGAIKILDISSRKLRIIREAPIVDSNFETVWDTVWYKTDAGEEEIMACFEDGRVCKYNFIETPYLKCTEIMKTFKGEGELKGIKPMRKCRDINDIPISRCSAARLIVLHPTDPYLYFIGTAEGSIHKCSTNYHNRHLDQKLAHDGPVNAIAFNPFIKKLFTTGGDDCQSRMWIEGNAEPIYRPYCVPNPVQDICYSPSYSTLIASTRRKSIFLWDYQRRNPSAQSETINPADCSNTLLRFTADGRCLAVGDIKGNVHVFSLEDMPFKPFFQANALYQGLKKRDAISQPPLKILEKYLSSNESKKYFN